MLLLLHQQQMNTTADFQVFDKERSTRVYCIFGHQWGKKTDLGGGGEQRKGQNRHKCEALLIANVTREAHSHKPVPHFPAFMASANLKEKAMKPPSKNGFFFFAPMWC